MSTHHNVLIIGGGTAGIMTAAQLLKKDNSMDVAIIEPNDTLLPTGLDACGCRYLRHEEDRANNGLCNAIRSYLD